MMSFGAGDADAEDQGAALSKTSSFILFGRQENDALKRLLIRK